MAIEILWTDKVRNACKAALNSMSDEEVIEIHREWLFALKVEYFQGDLQAFILQCAEEQSVADDKGNPVWLCPFGCHTIDLNEWSHVCPTCLKEQDSAGVCWACDIDPYTLS